jgi:exopolysaccharide biosynthesis polyprenyl glycosylphosphotransferase
VTLLADMKQVKDERGRIPVRAQLARLVLVLFLVDAGIVILTTAVGWALRGWLAGFIDLDDGTVWTTGLNPFICVVWLVSLAVSGAYRRTNLGAGFDEYRAVAIATGVTFALVATSAFMLKSPLSRGYLLICVGVGGPALLVSRYIARKIVHHLRRRGILRARVIAVCDPGALHEILSTLDRLHYVGYRVVGTCLPSALMSPDAALPVPCYGGVDDVLAACRAARADTVLVAGGGYTTSQALRQVGWALEGQNIDLVVVPSLIDVAGPRIHMRQVSGLPLVHVQEPQADRAGGWVKRTFDILVSAALLLAVSPLMLAIAVAVKLQDGGPALFRQERSGQHGRTFEMTKFRSMVPAAEDMLAGLLHVNDSDAVLFKVREDPRVTRLGRLLRRYSLDELPQLIDVLRGDMSIVGPRPPLPHEVEQYPPDMHRRLLVRPGLTGLWQVSGRSDLSFDEAVRMDLYYVDNWSITGDVLIMLKTVRAVLTGRGAY